MNAPATPDRTVALGWAATSAHLDESGWALVEQVLTADERRADAK